MKTVFMVAEKPLLANTLANILSNGKFSSRKGLNGVCSVHEWKGTFRQEFVLFRMTSVCGHVLSVDFPSRYNNWDLVDPIELFSCKIERKESTPKLRMNAFLSNESRGCEYLVLWLDCDKEGENICFEVIEAVKNSMKYSHFIDDVVFRAKFSSITPKDVKAAMMSLVKPNKNESLSVDARQELDLRIGCAFTRFQTKFFHGKYGNLDSSLISFGPCQTPTLGFCVERHDRIQTFKPEPYWMLTVTVWTKDQRKIVLSHQNGRFFDKDAAKFLLKRVNAMPYLKVTKVTAVDKYKTRPVALNTVELLRMASSHLGVGPHHAMAIAERLYTQGYISYPRTETTKYSENFDFHEVLHMFERSDSFGHFASNILKEGVNVAPKGGHDIGDHPPITPLNVATNVTLDGESWKLYEYIVQHFLATISADCKYKSTTVSFEYNADKFTYSEDCAVSAGYTDILTWHRIGGRQGAHLSRGEFAFVVGDEAKIDSVQLAELKTTPPDYMTESELITQMEKHGIGTDASIPVHINNIIQRNYVTIGNGRKLIPTNLGIVLIHGYQKIDKELIEPSMRCRLEGQLNLIAKGEADYSTVLSESVGIFRSKFEFFCSNIDEMDNLFEVSFTRLADSGKAMSRCGKCRRYLKYIQARPNRLHCAHCNATYSVPQGGNIRTFKELRCPIDDFELLAWTSGINGKSFIMCPHCYTIPHYPKMPRQSSCGNCLDKVCSFSVFNMGVSNCDLCKNGVLVLDPSSAPKWKLVCNTPGCDALIQIFKGAQVVSIDEKDCNKCGAQLVNARYKEDRTRLPGDRLEITECIFCFSELGNLIQHKHARSSRPAYFNKRGKRRGRGGGSGGKVHRGRGNKGENCAGSGVGGVENRNSSASNGVSGNSKKGKSQREKRRTPHISSSFA